MKSPYRKPTIEKMAKALKAVEDDAKDTKEGERIKITGATMGAVQAALNDMDNDTDYLNEESKTAFE